MPSLSTENFSGIKVRVRQDCESTLRDLNFFTKDGWASPGKTSIIYGPNGAGKSSLGYALSKPLSVDSFLYLESGNFSSEPAPAECSNIFVFNDRYISENLLVETLKSIVLLGPQVELKGQIDAKRKELHSLQKQAEERADLSELLSNKQSDTEKQLKERLKAENSWAGRQRRIENVKEKRTTSRVVSKVQQARGDLADDFEYADALSQFESTLKQLTRTQGGQVIEWEPPHVRQYFDRTKVEEVLHIESLRGVSSDTLRQRLFDEQLSIVALERLASSLSARHSCPTCFQDLSPAHKKEVLTLIDQEVKALRSDEIASSAVTLKEPDTFQCAIPADYISDDLCSTFKEALDDLNEQISAINLKLEQKATNPRVRIEVDFSPLSDAERKMTDVLDDIQKEVNSYNSSLNARSQLIQELSEHNSLLSAFETKSEIDAAHDAEKDWKTNTIELRSIESAIRNTTEEILNLEKRQHNETDAVEEINRLLAIVFGPNRMSLRIEEAGYSTWSRSARVQPRELSTGEKNIMALCYFLVSMARNLSYENSHGAERLIILDDPISSFDRDNKYGVLALLMHFANENIFANSETRLLILTHDQEVAYSLSKAFKDLPGNQHVDKEYKNFELSDTDFENFNEYKTLLERAFKYSFEDSTGVAPQPNELRKIYEAFVTFTLDGKITTAASEPFVKAHLQEIDPLLKAFADRYLARIFINPGSHSAMNMRIQDFGLFYGLSDEENRRFMRETLIFIHLLSPLHIPGVVASSKKDKESAKVILDNAVEQLKLELTECGG